VRPFSHLCSFALIIMFFEICSNHFDFIDLAARFGDTSTHSYFEAFADSKVKWWQKAARQFDSWIIAQQRCLLLCLLQLLLSLCVGYHWIRSEVMANPQWYCLQIKSFHSSEPIAGDSKDFARHFHFVSWNILHLIWHPCRSVNYSHFTDLQ